MSGADAAAAAKAKAALAAFSLDATLGADFIGFAAATAVFGILTSQVFTYFKRYPADKPAYKLLVAGLWVLEVMDQCFIGHQFYFYSITNYGNPLVLLDKIVWSLVLQVEVGALVGTIVQACFAMRVWRFSGHNIPITGLVLGLTIARMGTATLFTVKAFELESLTKLHDLKAFGTLSLALGVATDAVTAVALCWFLSKLKTGYSNSDSLVNSLSLYAVNTGALTSAFSLSTLILYNIMPTNFIFMGCYFVVSKLYAVSFLATLNTRRTVRGKGTDRERTDPSNSFHMLTNPRSDLNIRSAPAEEHAMKKLYPIGGFEDIRSAPEYHVKSAPEYGGGAS
ncbi:hypothetical protein GLOTRDRAFT_81515 [Gloeophyllum trabeum ATCC 11539]|uniref:DUF6534 domain-containing protein n=1 Tax=Gloeophyllum trabeum (strain ATCC 11539 / FP-39264 / Madison 617) TaxID=670483 RepID=S7R9N0_GLOTA|nr:uncharacterized protein GLOTRDRAFT_81515 [Gloeophyllum trabeum ATCC 11539]EPQ50960.1 hypothetical protein GLOTRDRAFT_81515 [Gloeophyllum trabeum ATCC 11539]